MCTCLFLSTERVQETGDTLVCATCSDAGETDYVSPTPEFGSVGDTCDICDTCEIIANTSLPINCRKLWNCLKALESLSVASTSERLGHTCVGDSAAGNADGFGHFTSCLEQLQRVGISSACVGDSFESVRDS